MKSIIFVVVFCLTLIATAQTAKKATSTKPAARPATAGPTHVTGPGVKTPTGLRYWDIKAGTGAEAHSGQKVKVHYTGWLTSGKKFDSSVGGPPFQFKIDAGDVIKGWDQGVAGMK